MVQSLPNSSRATNYLIDNKAGIIVDAEGTRAEAFEQSRRERKKVEMCFAHMKRPLPPASVGRSRLYGVAGLPSV